MYKMKVKSAAAVHRWRLSTILHSITFHVTVVLMFTTFKTVNLLLM